MLHRDIPGLHSARVGTGHYIKSDNNNKSNNNINNNNRNNDNINNKNNDNSYDNNVYNDNNDSISYQWN